MVWAATPWPGSIRTWGPGIRAVSLRSTAGYRLASLPACGREQDERAAELGTHVTKRRRDPRDPRDPRDERDEKDQRDGSTA